MSQAVGKAVRSSVGVLDKAKGTVFMLCDVQTRFKPLIWQMDSVIHASNTLLAGAKAMGCPTVATEQYSKAFGPIGM